MSAAIFPPPTLAFYTPLIAGGILIALVLASIWMFGLAKCLQDPTLTRRKRMAWALFIVIFNFIGACLYLAYHVDAPSPTLGGKG